MPLNHQPDAIRESDLRLLSYAELGGLLEILTENIRKVCRERNLHIDAVAPILRSGAFPGCHLASKLDVLDILPLQYKHTYDPAHPIRRLLEVPKLNRALNRPIFLLTDTNTVTGEIAECAASDIRAIWPDSTILFACVMLDASLESIRGIDILISARRTNERRTLSSDAAKKAGLSEDVYVFPWEESKQQWAEIQAAQFISRPEVSPE